MLHIMLQVMRTKRVNAKSYKLHLLAARTFRTCCHFIAPRGGHGGGLLISIILAFHSRVLEGYQCESLYDSLQAYAFI